MPIKIPQTSGWRNGSRTSRNISQEIRGISSGGGREEARSLSVSDNKSISICGGYESRPDNPARTCARDAMQEFTRLQVAATATGYAVGAQSSLLIYILIACELHHAVSYSRRILSSERCPRARALSIGIRKATAREEAVAQSDIINDRQSIK